MKWLLFMAMAGLVTSSDFFREQSLKQEECGKALNCGDCIQIALCSWCGEIDLPAVPGQTLPRCSYTLSTDEEHFAPCRRSGYFVPSGWTGSGRSLRLGEWSDGSSGPLQLRPQVVRTRIVVARHQQFDVDFKRARYSPGLNKSVTLTDNAQDPLSLRYFTDCGKNISEYTPMTSCEDVGMGDEIGFKIFVRLAYCPSDQNLWKQKFLISAEGFDDAVTVELEMLCSCPGDTPTTTVPTRNLRNEEDTSCSGHGVWLGGECVCEDGYLGSECECEDGGLVSEDHCRANDNDTALCSGQGRCGCGYCHCHNRENSLEYVYGRFCECTNFLCPANDMGELCGGRQRGECECSECKCFPLWSGDDCGCSLGTDMCVAGGSVSSDTSGGVGSYTSGGQDADLCSGQGTCECNVCKCAEGEGGKYFGRHCEFCPTCDGHCLDFASCVECWFLQLGDLRASHECRDLCDEMLDVEMVGDIAVEGDEQLCTISLAGNCSYQYTYAFDDHFTPRLLRVQTDSVDCGVNTVAVALGVVGCMVTIALLFLCVSVLLHYRTQWGRGEGRETVAMM